MSDPRKKVGVLISGRGSNLGALIEAAEAPDYPAEIALVVSNRGDAAGLELAADHGIETEIIRPRDYASREAFDQSVDQRLQDAGIEIVCLAGYMRLLSAPFVDSWLGRLINIHPSLLPAFKGLNVHERVIEEGAARSGCTVHFVTPEMDEGPVIGQRMVRVAPDDTAETLAQRVLKQEHQLYPACLAYIATGQCFNASDEPVLEGDSVDIAGLL